MSFEYNDSSPATRVVIGIWPSHCDVIRKMLIEMLGLQILAIIAPND